MQAMLNIRQDEINKGLIDLIKSLFSGNVDEIVIKKSTVKLEEFDTSLPHAEVISQMSNHGYSQEFLNEIQQGLEASVESKR